MNNHSGDCRRKLAVVLPSLNPDVKFSGVVSGLCEGGFEHIVIVDDGSSEDHQHFFSEAEQYPQCTVLHHEVNRGKGRALKTAFSYVLDHLPDLQGVITIDGDGQHLLGDIIRCGDRMLENGDKVVLGCRDFDLPQVPPRSVAGNKFTAKAFRIFFGIRLSDTQTGLRAIPAEYLRQFCEIDGERFEYETNMLLQMKRSGIDFLEQPIETIYDPEDYSSHYNAVRDSWKLGKVMLKFLLTGSGVKYVLSSILSLAADYVMYYILLLLLGLDREALSHLLSTFLSSIVNFNLNKFWVFKKYGDYGRELLAYYGLCIPRTLLSTLCASFTINHLSTVTPVLAVLVRVIVDGVLFIISYYIQRNWIFQKNKGRVQERDTQK